MAGAERRAGGRRARMSKLAAKDVIFTLGMRPHPEGGWYARTFEDGEKAGGRARSTAIYHLLETGDASHWHRIHAVEVGPCYAGSPLKPQLSDGQRRLAGGRV